MDIDDIDDIDPEDFQHEWRQARLQQVIMTPAAIALRHQGGYVADMTSIGDSLAQE